MPYLVIADQYPQSILRASIERSKIVYYLIILTTRLAELSRKKTLRSTSGASGAHRKRRRDVIEGVYTSA
jgi:hypothetical protein